MDRDRRLAVTLLQAVALAVGALLLHDIGPFFDPPSAGILGETTGLNLNNLAWAMASLVLLGLLRGLADWLLVGPRLSSLLRRARVAEPSNDRSELARQVVRVLARNAVWLALLTGALLDAPDLLPLAANLPFVPDAELIREYSGVLTDLAPWAFWVLVAFVLARLVSVRFPVVGRVVRVPRAGLAVLGISYVLLARNGVLATAFSFHSSPLLMVVSASAGLFYLARVARRYDEIRQLSGSHYGVGSRMVALSVGVGGALATSAAGTTLYWGAVGSLPNVTSALLDHSITAQFGRTSIQHFSVLFDGRWLMSGAVLAIALTLGIRDRLDFAVSTVYRPFLMSAGLSIAGCSVWMLGVDLSPLGHAYLLIGAALAAGLFSMALAQLASYVTNARITIVSESARWLAGSASRAFVVGSSMAWYGLLVRPMLYEMLWFAQVFEWLVVLTVAAILFFRTTGTVRTAEVPAGPEPTTLTDWARHTQTIEAVPDVRFDSLVSVQQRYVESGEWGSIWSYLLPLMYRNGVSVEDAEAAFRPLRTSYAETVGRPSWLLRLRRTSRRRREALSEAQKVVETALSSPSTSLEPIDESMVRAISKPFIEDMGEPDSLAVTLVAAYRQQGADLSQATVLWYPLVTFADDEPRWFSLPGPRAELRRRNRARRRVIVEGAIAHLFRGGTQEDLTVAVMTAETPVFTKRSLNGFGAADGYLPSGSAIEVIEEDETSYLVRMTDGATAYVALPDLIRQPVLPSDRNG